MLIREMSDRTTQANLAWVGDSTIWLASFPASCLHQLQVLRIISNVQLRS